MKRIALLAALPGLLLGLVPPQARAQGWKPDKPIEIVVPTTPGGGIDPRKLKAIVLGSGGDAVTALLGGHIDAHTGTPSSVVRMVQAGQIRALAILAPKRIGGPYAGTPTWTELGYKAVMDTWRGVIGPKGMTAAQIAWWDGVLAKAVATPAWKEALEQNTWEANCLNSAQTRKRFESEHAEYRAILGELGMLKPGTP
jgi:putative tricarboxylic transport membrane protein